MSFPHFVIYRYTLSTCCQLSAQSLCRTLHFFSPLLSLAYWLATTNTGNSTEWKICWIQVGFTKCQRRKCLWLQGYDTKVYGQRWRQYRLAYMMELTNRWCWCFIYITIKCARSQGYIPSTTNVYTSDTSTYNGPYVTHIKSIKYTCKFVQTSKFVT